MGMLFVLGLGVWMVGTALRGVPNMAPAGNALMGVGGLLVVISALKGA